MLFADLATTSAAVAATSKRLEKRELLAQRLREADEADQAGEADEVNAAELPLVATFLAGEICQRRTGIGWASLPDVPPAAAPTLTVADVDVAFARAAELTGPGSQTARTALVHDLFAAATDPEQALLRGLISGGVRQGALDAALLDAAAAATSVPLADIRRGAMLAGSVAAVAAAFTGADAVRAITLRTGHGVKPMLAAAAPTVAAALEMLPGEVTVDTKLDGIRLQAHRRGDDVRLFSRSLDDLTARLPQVVTLLRELPQDEIILDGELLALDAAGTAVAFQDIAGATVDGGPLLPVFFDCLRLGERDLLTAPLRDRLAVLDDVVPAVNRSVRLDNPTLPAAERFFADTVASGREGVVIKSLDAGYEAGRRGASWVKVKPRHTLDLVVLAVEQGSGRRRGYLSNIHLGARDGDGYVMVGKTFKGMTDEMLCWQTTRFRELETERPRQNWERGDHVVTLRPEQVVEVAIDGVQRSSRYPGGVALRFARVLRYRDDKPVSEIDTIAAVQALL